MAARKHFVRVHETRSQFANTPDDSAFNLDNFAQFTRYAQSVIATNRKTHILYHDFSTQGNGEGKIHYVSLAPRSYPTPWIHLTAQLERRHGECKFCQKRFNNAGNGSRAV